MKTKWNWIIILALFVGLVFTEPKQTVLAAYTDGFGVYNQPSLYLIQQVGGVSISPETLPNAEYETTYSQQLAASGGTEPYTFSLLSGPLPSGISLSDTGLLSGYPDGTTDAIPGTYPITIQVQDANSVTASRAYDFVLAKGVPTVTVYAPPSPYSNSPFDVSAEVTMPITSTSRYLLSGTAAFTIDDIAVPGCSAVPYLNFGYLCEKISMILSVGPHTVNVAYTPADSITNYYSTANASSVINVQTSYYNIAGTLFMDQNKDGVLDIDEYGVSGFTVNLDQGCDGTVDSTTTTNYFGSYQFYDNPGDKCYRITVADNPGWQQTSQQLPDIWLSGNTLSENIGFYYPTIIVSPSGPALPNDTIEVEYSQVFSASGGTEPYTYTVVAGTLPDGLTLSSAGTLSGTPTMAGYYNFDVQAKDANQAIGYNYYSLLIELVKVDGVFNFTSSSNPSAPGEAVTFTVSATGTGIDAYYGTVPPIGNVTFFDDGTAIEGCADLYLNMETDENGNLVYKADGDLIIGDYPATCTTAALVEGTHEITATYVDWSGVYSQPTLGLKQEVVVSKDTTPPVITPVIEGKVGQNDWYTSDVNLSWTVTDDESAITSTKGCDPVSITSDQISRDYVCTATSTGGTNEAIVYIQRDATSPDVSVTGVTEGAAYPLGSVPEAACMTEDKTSGVAVEASLSLKGGDAQGLGDITATCSGAQDNAGNAADPVAVHFTVIPSADLSITTADKADPVKPNSKLTYTLTVSNLGPNPAESITLTDKLDVTTTFVSVSAPKGWSCSYAANSGIVTCTSDSLASGGSAIIKITVKVDKTAKLGKDLVNNAQVTSATFDADLINNAAMEKTLVAK